MVSLFYSHIVVLALGNRTGNGSDALGITDRLARRKLPEVT